MEGVWGFRILFVLSIMIFSLDGKILGSDGLFSHDSDADNYGKEVNSIDIDIKPGNALVEYNENGVWICPETFELTFDLDAKPFSIHLVRAPGIRSTKLPIYISERNKVWLYDRQITKQYCNYQDGYTSSSFTIILDNSHYLLDGSFRQKDKLFGIRPKQSTAKRLKRSLQDTHEHFLYLLAQDENFSNSQTRRKRSTKTRYEVEVFVVVDYSVYERFEKFGVSGMTTEEQLAYYFSHVLNEVGTRFAGITDQDYEIRVFLTGLMAAQTPDGSPWTNHTADKIISLKLLESFTSYVNDILPKIIRLPSFDHAMLFTEKDLYYLSSLGIEMPSSSIGYLDYVCQEKRTSIVKKSYHMFTVVNTAAKRLAFNLGARTDGDGNSCPSSKLYIMASTIKMRTAENYRNIFQFSSCSKWAIRTVLADISLSNSCLFNTTTWDDTAMRNLLMTPPGQRYSLDHQCQAINGPASYFCGIERDKDELCSGLTCYIPDRTGCFQFNDIPAYQGTTCGNKMWCVDGKCVYNSTAPATNSNCLFGEFQGILIDGVKCEEAITNEPYLCYNSTYRDKCCGLCASIHEPQNVGCEYGDKQSLCKTAGRLICIYGNRDLCCETCKQFRQPLVSIFSNMAPNSSEDRAQQEPVTPIPASLGYQCGGNLMANETLQPFGSPGYPVNYADNLTCEWLITTDAGYRIFFNITDIDLEPAPLCRFDYIGFQLSGNSTSPVTDKLCRKLSAGTIVYSEENKLFVRFHSDHRVSKKGFSAAFKSICGGKIEGRTQGSIKNPGFPTSYRGNSNCTWQIEVDAGQTVQIAFQEFSLPGTSGQCSGDKLQLFNGPSTSSRPMAGSPFCGAKFPEPLQTTSKYLTVVWTSSSNPPGGFMGFSMTFVEKAIACGGNRTLNDVVKEGYLASPDYPFGYPPFTTCTWVITSPSFTRIKLEFDRTFELEEGSRCLYDYVEVRDGPTIRSQRIGRYCGTNNPRTLESTNNAVYVRFKSDIDVSGAGFRLKYSLAGCGGKYEGVKQGSIISPGYPTSYQGYANCSWLVEVDPGQAIQVAFQEFNLPGINGQCGVDKVQLFNGPSTASPPMFGSPFCGTSSPSPLNTTSKYLTVVFTSSSNPPQVYTGFNMTFVELSKTCGGNKTLNDDTQEGYLASPDYPNGYPANFTCVWIITSPSGTKIQLAFDSVFGFEEDSACSFDFVEVRDGSRQGSPLIDRFCGSVSPGTVMSTNNAVYVRFVSDVSFYEEGFRLKYSIADDRILSP